MSETQIVTERKTEEVSSQVFVLRWSHEIETFKRIIKTLSKVQEELTFDINQNGLSYRAMDASHVSLIDMSLVASDFEKYESSKDTRFTIRAEDLLSRLERGSKGDSIELSMSKADSLDVNLRGKRNKAFSLYTIESSQSNTPLPKLNFDSSFTIAAKDLIETIKDIETTSNHVTLKADSCKVRFSGKGDCGTVSDEFTDLTVETAKDSAATYSIEYLNQFLNTLEPETVQVEFSSKMPLRLTVRPIENGKSILQFYLAPRVQE
jgi:proliferating cell nuclear antigen